MKFVNVIHVFFLCCSYAAIIGGTITVVGTSTNLVVYALLKEKTKEVTLPLFEVGMVGAPIAVLGLIYVVIAGRWLLPERVAADEQLAQNNNREYTLAASVAPGSSLVGKYVLVIMVVALLSN